MGGFPVQQVSGCRAQQKKNYCRTEPKLPEPEIRDHPMAHRTITYSRNIFLPLTTVCRNRCGYCCFRTPAQEGCLLAPEVVEETVKKGAALGCT